MEPPNQPTYEFGPFCLDAGRHEFLRNGEAVALPPKAFEILLLLVEGRGGLLSKNDLIRRVWPDTFVDENNLAQHISLLRKVLGESPDEPQYIETIPRVGYRFVAEVRLVATHSSMGKRPAAEPGGMPATAGAVRSREGMGAAGESGDDRAPKSASYPYRMLGALALAGLALVGLLVPWPIAAPTILHSTQLTRDGYPKHGAVMTDGEFVYFVESRNGLDMLVRVPTTGGEPMVVGGIRGEVQPVDLSPSRREILALETSVSGQESQLWVCALPGGPFRRLGNLTGSAAAWSPDGSRLYYARGEKMYAGEKDGSNPKELFAAEGRISALHVSPDGRSLRFLVQHVRGSIPEVWEAQSDGSHLRPFPSGMSPENEVYVGSWTGDERYFFFTTYLEGAYSFWALRRPRRPFEAVARTRLDTNLLNVMGLAVDGPNEKIYVIGALDRVETLRYDPNPQGLTLYLQGVSADGLAFSRQGDRVAYTTYPQRALFTSRLDGTEKRELTSGSRKALLPAWSPDGSHVAYMEHAPAGPWKIQIVSSDGGGAVELLPGSDDEGHPTWSADGNSLIYAGVPWIKGFELNSTAIHQVDLRTRKVETLPDSAGLWSPRMSPDGKLLVAEACDLRRLLLFDFATRKWTPLVNVKDESIGYTSWSRDSRYVYYNTYFQQRGTIFRIDMQHHVTERVSLPEGIDGPITLGQWFTLAPDDSPLVLRDVSLHELFALDLRLP
jgi:DNA-binding winged helix-turn-helix (wHTH) protein/Tol biopolymer transport system component